MRKKLSDRVLRGLAFLLGCLGLTSSVAEQSAFSQGLGWAAHTPFTNVTAVSQSDSALWVATAGGVFKYSPSTEELRPFTTTDGLFGVEASAIAYDAGRNAVWVGYPDGVLDRIDTETFEINSFQDLARAVQFQRRGIRRLMMRGDSLFAATDFGLVVFDPTSQEVTDAFTKFSELDAGIAVNDVAVLDGANGGELWVATDQGVAHAPLDGTNLKEPSAWSTEITFQGQTAYALAIYDGKVVAGLQEDAHMRQLSGIWTALQVTNRQVLDLTVIGDKILASEPFSLRAWLPNNTVVAYNINGDRSGKPTEFARPVTILEGPDGNLWIGDAREGIAGFSDFPPGSRNIDVEYVVSPPGPTSGLFTDLVFDSRDQLWTAAISGPGSGYYVLGENGEWTNYTNGTAPALEGKSAFDFIHVDSGDNVWSGSAGHGLARTTSDGSVEIFDADNSSLRPAAGTDFLRVRGITSEQDGSVWVINEFNPEHLHHRSQDGTWNGVQVRASGLSQAIDFDRIWIDSNGQKWITPLRAPGIIIWDSGEDPLGSADDESTYIRTRGALGVGLPSESVTAWAEDNSGRVWIGTDRGAAFFFAPSLILDTPDPSSQIQWPQTTDANGNRSSLLRDLAINDIAIDPADQKWFATNNGAWLVNSEGDGILEHFTVDNSPLLSNDVLAVAVQQTTGRVYFATDKGMVSFQGDATRPAPEIQELKAFPNPVIASSGSIPSVVIEGLVGDTDVRILSASGSRIRQLDGRGGRVRWDGMDDFGQPVPSGMYLMVAVGRNGEGTAYGKIAVVR